MRCCDPCWLQPNFSKRSWGSDLTVCERISLHVESIHWYLPDFWKPLLSFCPPGKALSVAQDIIETVLEFGTESEQTTAFFESLAQQVLVGAGSASVGLLEKTTHFRRVTVCC